MAWNRNNLVGVHSRGKPKEELYCVASRAAINRLCIDFGFVESPYGRSLNHILMPANQVHRLVTAR